MRKRVQLDGDEQENVGNYIQERASSVSHSLVDDLTCQHKCQHAQYPASVATTPAYLQHGPAGYRQQSYVFFSFLRPSRQIPGQYRKINHDRFLPQPFSITAYARI